VIEPEEQYKLLLESRREESDRFWTVFSLLVAINGGLLAFSGVAFRDPEGIVPCIFGIAICAVWALLQRGYRFWVLTWERRLGELEYKHSVLPVERRVFGEVEDKRPSRYRWSTKNLGVRLADFFLLFWLILAGAAVLAPLRDDKSISAPAQGAAQPPVAADAPAARR
jgi:hypothetical protein